MGTKTAKGTKKRGTPKGSKRGRAGKGPAAKANTGRSDSGKSKKPQSPSSQSSGPQKPSRDRQPEAPPGGHYVEINPDALWLYGRHCVMAALENPNRKFDTLMATKQGTQWLLDQGLRDHLIAHQILEIAPSQLDEILPAGCVHQGVAASVKPLSQMTIEEFANSAQPKGPVLVLDQITDPQNIGAIFRSAAAFGVEAIIVQDRRTPALAGALAKAAAGAIEICLLYTSPSPRD